MDIHIAAIDRARGRVARSRSHIAWFSQRRAAGFDLRQIHVDGFLAKDRFPGSGGFQDQVYVGVRGRGDQHCVHVIGGVARVAAADADAARGLVGSLNLRSFPR